MRTIRVIAVSIGVVMLAQGTVGLLRPVAFVQLLQAFQSYPAICAAAAIRIAAGVLLVMAAAIRQPEPGRLRPLEMAVDGSITPVSARGEQVAIRESARMPEPSGGPTPVPAGSPAR